MAIKIESETVRLSILENIIYVSGSISGKTSDLRPYLVTINIITLRLLLFTIFIYKTKRPLEIPQNPCCTSGRFFFIGFLGPPRPYYIMSSIKKRPIIWHCILH